MVHWLSVMVAKCDCCDMVALGKRHFVEIIMYMKIL